MCQDFMEKVVQFYAKYGKINTWSINGFNNIE